MQNSEFKSLLKLLYTILIEENDYSPTGRFPSFWRNRNRIHEREREAKKKKGIASLKLRKLLYNTNLKSFKLIKPITSLFVRKTQI